MSADRIGIFDPAGHTNYRHHIAQDMQIFEALQIFRSLENIDHLTNVVLSNQSQEGVNALICDNTKNIKLTFDSTNSTVFSRPAIDRVEALKLSDCSLVTEKK
jgi:hypothetical protein